MKPISDNVYSLLKNILIKKNPILAAIIFNWSNIVGKELSTNTNPFKITQSRENNAKINVLHIEANNASLSMQVFYQQEIILERISIYLGFRAINKIKLIVV